MEEMKYTPLNLDNMSVASPCTAAWEDMDGDDRTRHCSSCTKNVYNISEMTRGEAEALIKEKEGHLCVRFYRRHDGTVLTDDCPVGLRAIRAGCRKVATAAASLLALLISTGAALAGNDNSASSKSDPQCVKKQDQLQPTMGKIKMATPSQTMGFAAPHAVLPKATTGEAWIPKFQKSVEAQLKDNLGAQIKAPMIQFYLTVANDGSVVTFATSEGSISADDQKSLETVRQMKFKAFPKETKLKQVIILTKIAKGHLI